MHIAAIRATKEFVQNLVEAGANPNAAEKNGRRLSKDTPLQMSSSMGKLETAKYLKDLGTAVDSIKFYSKLKLKKNDPLHGMKKGSPLPPVARPGGGRMIDPGFGRGGH